MQRCAITGLGLVLVFRTYSAKRIEARLQRAKHELGQVARLE